MVMGGVYRLGRKQSWPIFRYVFLNLLNDKEENGVFSVNW